MIAFVIIDIMNVILITALILFLEWMMNRFILAV